jgi:hypothetical protein
MELFLMRGQRDQQIVRSHWHHRPRSELAGFDALFGYGKNAKEDRVYAGFANEVFHPTDVSGKFLLGCAQVRESVGHRAVLQKQSEKIGVIDGSPFGRIEKAANHFADLSSGAALEAPKSESILQAGPDHRA